MDIRMVDNLSVQNPFVWAERCRSRAGSETNTEAKAALTQMAEEFEAMALEFEGLVSGFEAVVGSAG